MSTAVGDMLLVAFTVSVKFTCDKIDESREVERKSRHIHYHFNVLLTAT